MKHTRDLPVVGIRNMSLSLAFFSNPLGKVVVASMKGPLREHACARSDEDEATLCVLPLGVLHSLASF